MPNILEQAREIRKTWSAFQSSRVLITANNYRVFDYLEKPRTAKRLARQIHSDMRATEILLDALTGMGFLKKQKGEYSNRSSASRFLVSGKPYYQGDIVRHADSIWKSWSNLDSVLITGKPSRGPRNHEAFILGMHNLAALKAKEVIKAIDLKGVRTSIDLGGGPGTYSMEMAGKGIKVTLFDTPETIKIAKKVIKKTGVKRKNINLVEGDFISDDIGGGYDLIFISQIIRLFAHRFNSTLCRAPWACAAGSGEPLSDK